MMYYIVKDPYRPGVWHYPLSASTKPATPVGVEFRLSNRTVVKGVNNYG